MDQSSSAPLPSTGEMPYLPDRKLTIMERKFYHANLAREAGTYKPLYDSNYDYGRFHTTHFFFYGTLMDPKVLAKVLGRAELPRGVPAKTMGYKIMLWGQYPALTFAENGVVEGFVYEIETQEEVDRLERYEGENYRITGVRVKLQDGSDREMSGRVFRWCGDCEELREGVFDLKDFQQRQCETEGEDVTARTCETSRMFTDRTTR